MKAVQVNLDETLLKELDASEEVRRHGRSAVLRRAVAEYLRRGRSRRIAEGYKHAYGDASGLGGAFEGWEDEGQWPAE